MQTISIAKVLKPQGLKGELKCKALTEDFSLFSSLKYVICENKKYNIISSVYRLGYVYIMLESIDFIDKAERFRNKVFEIEKNDYQIEEDKFFVDDLIGIKIFSERGGYIGCVIDIENYGATDILVVEEKGGVYSVPFVKKIFTGIYVNTGKLVANDEYEVNKV